MVSTLRSLILYVLPIPLRGHHVPYHGPLKGPPISHSGFLFLTWVSSVLKVTLGCKLSMFFLAFILLWGNEEFLAEEKIISWVCLHLALKSQWPRIEQLLSYFKTVFWENKPGQEQNFISSVWQQFCQRGHPSPRSSRLTWDSTDHSTRVSGMHLLPIPMWWIPWCLCNDFTAVFTKGLGNNEWMLQTCNCGFQK
jgi:hypothetical protein